MIALLALMSAAATGASLSGSSSSSSRSAGHTASGSGARFAAQGGPWEFNLRDLLRWADLTEGAVAAPRPAVSGDGKGGTQSGEGAAGLPQSNVLAGSGAPQAHAPDSATQQQQMGKTTQHGVAGFDAGVHARLDEAAEHYAHTLFVQRLRTPEDRVRFGELFARAWGRPLAVPGRVQVSEGGEGKEGRGSSTSRRYEGCSRGQRSCISLSCGRHGL
jgi:hypothetical protein